MIEPDEYEAFKFFLDKARTEGRSLADVLDNAGVLITRSRLRQIQETTLRRQMLSFDVVPPGSFCLLAGADPGSATMIDAIRGVRIWLEDWSRK